MTTIAERGQFAHVLLVEDNPGDATLTRLAFKRAGVQSKLTIAETGEIGLAILSVEGEHGYPDLILLDLNLPRMHGLEFLKRVKNDPKMARIPVIVLSSSSAESDIAASYLGHAVGFITKPISLDDFEEVAAGISTYWFKIVQTPAANDTPDKAFPPRTGT